MFHLVSYKWFRRTLYITSIGLFYRKWGVLWRVSDFEELVGVTHRRQMGLVLVNYLVKLLSTYSFGIPALIRPSIKISFITVGATFS